MKKLCVWAVAALLMAACTPKAEKTTDSGLLQSNFQMEVDGKKTDLYTLRNKNNMEVCVTNFGGRIVSVSASPGICSNEMPSSRQKRGAQAG